MSNVDITKVRWDSVCGYVASHRICEFCGFVNRAYPKSGDNNALRCPNCSKESNKIIFYVPHGATTMINLMAYLYYMKPKEEEDYFGPIIEQDDSGHQVAIVIFFNTLVEVLLQHFLEQCMNAKNIPSEVQSRLLEDNMFVKPRVEKLFPLVTGEKWLKAIRDLSKSAEYDYVSTVKFSKDVADLRNILLHEGNLQHPVLIKGLSEKYLPEQCLRQIEPLVAMFTDLHNKYALDKSEAR